MNGAEQLATIIPMLQEVAVGIEPSMTTAPTPCADFDVAGVLDHMTGLATAFAPAFRGIDAPIGSVPLAGSDRRRAFREAMAELLAAVQSDGALDRIVDTPGGPMPGADFARMVALDGTLHGWDLATSTGQAWELPTDLLRQVDDFARSALSDDNRGDAFAPERVPPADASDIERLAAFSGRDVGRA